MVQRDPSTRGHVRSKSLRSSSVSRVVGAAVAKQSKRLRADDGVARRGSNRERNVGSNSSRSARSGKENSNRRPEQGQQRGRLVLVRDMQNVDEMDEEETDDAEDVDENEEEESDHENVLKVNRTNNDLDDEEREDDKSDVEEDGDVGDVHAEDTSDYEDALPEMSATAGRGNNREGTLSQVSFTLILVTRI